MKHVRIWPEFRCNGQTLSSAVCSFQQLYPSMINESSLPLPIPEDADQLSEVLRHSLLSHEYAGCGKGQYSEHPADPAAVIQQHYTSGTDRGQAQDPEFFPGIAVLYAKQN